MSGVLAKPPGDCCLKATIHDGEPQGKIVEIAGLDTYVSEPESGKANGHVVFYFPDIFGHYVNSKLLADGFAKEGFLTLLPDYFRGDTLQKYLAHDMDFSGGFKDGFNFDEWKDKTKALTDDIVPRWVDSVKSQYDQPGRKYASVGYCWGAPYAIEQLFDTGICTAGGFAHPGFVYESHMYNLKKPLFMSCAEDDMTFPTEERRKATDILMKEKKKFQVQLFQGVVHGFAVKGDMSDPWQKYAKEQSFQGMIDWFSFWLKG